jgi:beta-mannosidase
MSRMNSSLYRVILSSLWAWRAVCFLPAFAGQTGAAQTWTVRLEEPTGIERRESEVVSAPLSAFGGRTQGFRVMDGEGREVPYQVFAGRLYFPASLRPGATPEYRVTCCDQPPGFFYNPMTARQSGMNRVELANSRFRMVIDLQKGAIVEAYNLTAGSQRTLNLVDLTPEKPDPNDIHGDEKRPDQPPTPVSGENNGWTSANGSGPATGVEVLAKGPLVAEVRLRRGAEEWTLRFAADSAWVRWKAEGGFRFASVSALPYLPFDRMAEVSEYRWPTGPGTGEPPANRVGAREWKQPPDGHFVYYRKDENYGALGIVSLTPGLEYAGAGSRKFEARMPAGGAAELGITFPRWRGNLTLLEARREARMLRQPVLVEVTGAEELSVAPAKPLARMRPLEARPLRAAPAEWKPEALELNGEWELAWGEKGGPPSSEWRKVRVPGTAHVQWLPAEQLYSREAAWVSQKMWWYRKRFTAPAGWAGRSLRLQFDATDYYADVFIDGRRAGRHEGYVDPWELTVTDRLKPGTEHELLVRVWTPVHYYWKHRSYTIKGAYGAVDQKPDDITATGIPRSVRLVAGAPVWIQDWSLDTRIAGGGNVDVELELATNKEAPGARWKVALTPRSFAGEGVEVEAPVSPGRITIPVRDARLWHTWDTGEPNLYTLDLRLVGEDGTVLDAKRAAVGLREIERVGDQFYLNRRKIFLRGTNIYFHLFLSEMGRKEYERDFAIIRRMNVNAVRLHCHFDNPEIYDLADEQGVLLWQDFLEAWYPHDREYSLHAARLFDNHIRYVRNRASVMAWAPSDEEDHVNYTDLAKHLQARAALLDPQGRWVQRSTGRYGDSHLYFGWYGGSVWQYAKMTEPLVTELGAPSLPSRASLDRFLGGKWPMLEHADDWRFHRLQIEEAIQNIGDPRKMTVDEFIRRSQDYTARLFQVALERARRNKAQGAGGIFHFFAIDIWPSVTMAAVDFYRVPMKVHDTVRRSFAPVLASVEYSRDEWKAGERLECPVWLINDLWKELAGVEVRWRIEGARVAANGRWNGLRAEADSARAVGTVAWPAEAGDWVLRTEVAQGGKVLSENLFEFRVR